ncbi:hypothetical protein VN1288_00780 [Helicobacter pylori]|nr:hypothetical protein VN1288_00780 [Helicobacter pylori]
MEKLFEKILHEMRSGIAFPLAFVVSFLVSIFNLKGVFQLIFEFVFQYTQNKILSFFFIFLLFYANFFIVGKIINKVLLWYRAKNEAKKYEQNERNKIDIKTAHQIHQFPDKIKKELYECYSKKQNKIPRTDELDCLIGHFSLRDFFEPTKDDYIVKPYVLRAIKKYHKIAFKSIYWQQNK